MIEMGDVKSEVTRVSFSSGHYPPMEIFPNWNLDE